MSFKPNVGLEKDAILQQIQQEHKMSLDYVGTKRDEFRNRLKLYNNQRKQREKIGILTLYTTMNTLLAVYYTDEMTVEFAGREIGDSRLADNINNTAKFDYDEMGMDTVNFFVQWDKFFYGVGLRDISTFNTTTNTPIATSMDPLSWLPDPRGGVDPMGGEGGFRFYGFEVDRCKDEMTEERGFFNLENLSAAQKDKDAEQTRIAKNEAYGLDTQFRDNQSYANRDYSQIDWYTMLRNENGGISKYLVTVNSTCTEIYRLEKIDPVTDEEIEDESLVPWPLVTNYYSPQRHNPFGVSVADLVEDKQRAKSVLANLRIAKEKADLYPMYIYNTQKIRNRRDLDFGFNKAIAVNLSKDDNINNVVSIMPKDKNGNSTFNQEQALDAETQIATGADQMQSGVLSNQDRTLGEVKQVTVNAQIRFLLGSRINAWGEKKFWALWYRLYRQYFSKTQKKIIRLQGGFGVKYSTITRKDFITVKDPDIYIGSKIELEQRKERERLAFAQVSPMLLQDPTRPIASKHFIERHMLKLNNISPDMIEIMCPDSPDEMDAKMENELLSRNELVKIELGEDHLSHMVIHAAAEDTPSKFAHIEAHKMAYIQSGQMERDSQMRMMSMDTNMNNSMASQSQAQIGNMMAKQNGEQPLVPPTQ